MENTNTTAPKELPGALFALPARVAEPHRAQLAERGIASENRIVRIDPYALDVCLFRGRDREDALRMRTDVAAVVGEGAFSEMVVARWGMRKVPYFCGKSGAVTVVPKPEEKSESDAPRGGPRRRVKPKDAEDLDQKSYQKVREVLDRFSKFSGGIDIAFHIEDRFEVTPPPPDREGAIHIYPWTHPPGISGEHFVRRFFGLLIDKDGASILTYEGVPGRGELVTDGETNIVQMIGNNWYLLFSVIEYYNRHTTIRIFEQALAAALRRYEALGRGARPRDAASPLTRKRFVKTTENWVQRILQSTEEMLKEDEKKIANLRQELAMRERSYASFQRVADDLKSGERTRAIIASLPVQWRRIRKNPRVEKLSLVGDGIQMTTTPITIAHGELRYPLGRFAVYINERGVLSVWNLDRLHPKGIPHPHINRDGTPCFGNATSAISSAVAEHRYADAVDYVTRWLADGYEEKLALHKITEWPAEKTETPGNGQHATEANPCGR